MNKKIWITGLIAAATISGNVFAKPLNVEVLNQKLKTQGATWTAKDSWVNHLSDTELKHLLNLKQTPKSEVQFITEGPVNPRLPTSLDWRNKGGVNYVSPVLNQANCGSCVAFASIATLETQLNISSLFPNLNNKLSPENLFTCGGGSCDEGWFPNAAAEYLKNTGVTDEACMPYLSGATGQDMTCSAACADSAKRMTKISDYSTPTNGNFDLNAIKTALQNGPLVTTVSVYADFMLYSSGVYKHTSGDFLGGHAVSIIGYDDSKNALIVRNSWGPDWGDKGFIYVDYSDISGIGNDTWSFQMPTISGAVATTSPRDYDYLNGTANFSASTNHANAASLQMDIYDGTSKVVSTQKIVGVSGTAAVDTTKWSDGRYEVVTTALDSSGKSVDQSTHNFFYVVNSKPNMTLSFVGNGVDLSQPVKDRIEFNVTSSSSPVPMSALEFHRKDSSGTETVTTSDVVLNQMTTGWRTNLVANGVYEIWFVGKITPINGAASAVESNHVKVTTAN